MAARARLCPRDRGLMARDTLLYRRDQARKARRVEAYAEVRQQLRTVLAELVPGHRVWVFGSLAKPGRFNDASDVDLALAEPPKPGVHGTVTHSYTFRPCKHG